MIFNNADVTEALAQWKSTKKKKYMVKVLAGSKKLIEAIVSQYDPTLRDDMIQAVSAKLIYGMEKFNPEYGTPLHTYFTTIIHNMCRTVLKTESRHYGLFDIDEAEEIPEEDDVAESIDTLELVTYCRNRFPTYDANNIDYAVIAFVNHLAVNGNKTSKAILSKLHKETGIDVKTLDLLHKIVIIILRFNYMEHVVFEVDEDGVIAKGKNLQPAFLPELIHIFGEDVANQFQVIFRGMTLRF